MSKIVIEKCKILQKEVVLEYLKTESSESEPAKCTEEQKNPPAKTFVKAMNGLIIHMAAILELIDVSAIKDIKKPTKEISEALAHLCVTGFTYIAPGTDKEGVVISGNSKVSSGKVWGFNTFTIRFNDQSENAYQFMDDLKSAIKLVQDEAVKYLNGNFGPEAQQKLDL